MKISQILNEAEDLDSKDLKLSQQLLPPADEEDPEEDEENIEIDDQDLDDQDSKDEDNLTDSQRKAVDEFKNKGYNLGRDLYAFIALPFERHVKGLGAFRKLLDEFPDNGLEFSPEFPGPDNIEQEAVYMGVFNADNNKFFVVYSSGEEGGYSSKEQGKRADATPSQDKILTRIVREIDRWSYTPKDYNLDKIKDAIKQHAK